MFSLALVVMVVLLPSIPRNKSSKLVSRRLVLIVAQSQVLLLLRKLMLLLPLSTLLFLKFPLLWHPLLPRSLNSMLFSWPLLLSRLTSRTWILKPRPWILVSLPRPLLAIWLLPMLWLLKSILHSLLPRPLMVFKYLCQIDFGITSILYFAHNYYAFCFGQVDKVFIL